MVPFFCYRYTPAPASVSGTIVPDGGMERHITSVAGRQSRNGADRADRWREGEKIRSTGKTVENGNTSSFRWKFIRKAIGFRMVWQFHFPHCGMRLSGL